MLHRLAMILTESILQYLESENIVDHNMLTVACKYRVARISYEYFS